MMVLIENALGYLFLVVLPRFNLVNLLFGIINTWKLMMLTDESTSLSSLG